MKREKSRKKKACWEIIIFGKISLKKGKIIIQNAQKINRNYVRSMNCNIDKIIVYFNHITKIYNVCKKKGGNYEKGFY